MLTAVGVGTPGEHGAAHFARPDARQITVSSAGETAVLNAIFGGAGHEFVTLAEHEVHDISAIANGFRSQTLSLFSAPRLVFKTPNLQSGYVGLPHDPLALTAGGGILLKGKKIELAAIVRGPFTTYPGTTYITFAINRGAGARLGPAFAGRPGITPDALVVVRVGPDGQSNAATIVNLTTGTTQPLNPPAIQVIGPVVRILVSTSQLPSQGFAASKYRFSVWTSTQFDGGFQNVGSFAPEYTMIPIGVETNVKPPTL
jgi:hypothetical protein